MQCLFSARPRSVPVGAVCVVCVVFVVYRSNPVMSGVSISPSRNKFFRGLRVSCARIFALSSVAAQRLDVCRGSGRVVNGCGKTGFCTAGVGECSPMCPLLLEGLSPPVVSFARSVSFSNCLFRSTVWLCLLSAPVVVVVVVVVVVLDYHWNAQGEVGM